jgi:DNA recombination protein RmuC
MTETLLIAVACLIVGAGLALLVVTLARRPQAEPEHAVADLARLQADAATRVEAMIGLVAKAQSQLQHNVNERLDGVTQRLSQSMQTSTQQTVEHLQKLNERIAVIDSAQKNLTDLTSQVTSLREVFANKQSRGAFGQGRMEAIVQDGLAKGSYEFQFTLSNGKRPDCCVFLAVDDRPLVIDAKFPLEGITAFRDAKGEDEKKQAAQRLRQDVAKHVTDISEKYLIPGETQDVALMFVPSESVFAELHDGFDDIVQKAYRARVVLVSPALLTLAIQVMQQIQKDARMRAAAQTIQGEVGHLMDDLGRLRDRVLKLQTHFGQANEDVSQILISADKVAKRGGRIESLEFGGEDAARDNVIPAPIQRKLGLGE